MSNVKVGDAITVCVDPEGNNGVDEAHGRVTRVNDDGTVNALASCDEGHRRLLGVKVFGSRKELDGQLDEYLSDVPKQPNADNTAKRDAVRTDVLRWITAGYVERPSAKPAPAPASSSPSSSSSTSNPPKKTTSAARKSTPRKSATATVPKPSAA
jgi:hypothetical protein